MTGSYLLYNQLHYNGLMTDWGLCNTLISLLWILRGRSPLGKYRCALHQHHKDLTF